MKKFALFLGILILTGAGCSDMGQSKKEEAAKRTQNFCAKQVQDAEGKITNFKPDGVQKKIYELWKSDFIKINNFSEDFFSKHIYIYNIYSFGKISTSTTLNFSIHYYYKVGDIYLPSVGTDEVQVKSTEFNTSSAEELNNRILKQDTFNPSEPHPIFGSVPSVIFMRYSWGTISIYNVKNVPQTMVSCEQAVGLLKSCKNDIVPSSIAFKPALGYAWLSGDSKDDSSKQNCSSATVDLFQGKVDGCYMNIRCSRVI